MLLANDDAEREDLRVEAGRFVRRSVCPLRHCAPSCKTTKFKRALETRYFLLGKL